MADQKGFTLIELLIVIAIIAILAVVLINLLNPAEIIRRSQDSARLTNLDNINQAIKLALSEDDLSATQRATVLCAGKGVPCYGSSIASGNTQKADGTGWVKVDFSSLKTAYLPTLPTDPVNNIPSHYYYCSDGNDWELATHLDSSQNAGLMSQSSGLYTTGSTTSLIGSAKCPLDFSSDQGSIAQNPPSGSGSGGGESPKTCGPPITFSVFEQNGWGGDWSHPLNTFAFNRKGADNYYHIILANLDGSNERVFGQSTPGFPQKTVGSPVYSPDGKYLAFVAEKADYTGNPDAATPGWGGYSDLWIARSDGSAVWQLTNTPSDDDHGTLAAQFSPNGKLLEWTEKTKAANIFNLDQSAGFWIIKVADFTDTPNGPKIDNVRTYSPGGDHFNETGGFSPDSTNLVITSDFETKSFWSNQIYRLDLASGNTTLLTDPSTYNEHPRYTLDGKVTWMSSKDQAVFGGGTDWWIMNADGSSRIRLSYLNDSSNPEYFGKQAWTGPIQTENWSTDGSFFFGDVGTNLLTNDGEILKGSLTCK